MTTDLEKQFFDTFGIEKQPVYSGSKLYNAFITGCEYPQITDRILLELICIVNDRRILPNCDVNGLKEYILKELCTMIMSEKVKQQIQALFKEE